MKKKQSIFAFIFLFFMALSVFCQNNKIDRAIVLKRNNPLVTSFDSLSSLSLGNGRFAFTVDATGLQSFPELYRNGIPLGTQSEWGWNSFPNDEKYKFEETLIHPNFGHGDKGFYSVQFKESGRRQKASDYFRANPHRLHLGIVGFEIFDSSGQIIDYQSVKSVSQTLDLYNGTINSCFVIERDSVYVQTFCHPQKDEIYVKIVSSMFSSGLLKLKLRFPYPTGGHTDDACDWNHSEKHQTEILEQIDKCLIIKRKIDDSVYFVRMNWESNMKIKKKEEHYFLFSPDKKEIRFSLRFAANEKEIRDTNNDSFENASKENNSYWNSYWKYGGFVDFSKCKDPRAKVLERRVVLSQYLMAIQCAGNMPPQETGLTYNSWYGKFHLEMHWWHTAHFALWSRIGLMERSLKWYVSVEEKAREIAKRQGYDGIRWMKMTDPSGNEAPSSIGSFLIWQQPHIIYLAELLYRQKHSKEIVNKYKKTIFESAEFMASFATFDTINNRYVLAGIIPAQEMFRPEEILNPPFELAYWYYGLNVAQQWRLRAGLKRNEQWDQIINKLSSLAAKDNLYLAAESIPATYHNKLYTSDHPSVLCAYGFLPESPLFKGDIMLNTFNWIFDKWNWSHTWGWDFPILAMTAARLRQPQKAIAALLMDERTNIYLSNGHNYQNKMLRIYLPGNGGLLTAIAMMCAGWDGCDETNPGFPKDGNWDVVWEDLQRMP
ncbi:hypothetical protein [Parabacteroides sp. Marseille-P3160]|uniref:hypothetical protein n=1 Tax=Parabacteroides sp. Marseille-P3160 TaxID=1917887 RepID=UPI0009BADA83|nr:hypothetical protein [Parabacteroides sp. Marseille-P3160]